MFDALSHDLGGDLTWFFGPVFHEVGGLQLSVRSQSCRPHHLPRGVFSDGNARKIVTEVEAPDTGAWSCEVIVQNTGTIHVPVDIALRFADGSEERYVWEDRGAGAWDKHELERSSKLTDVIIDPDNKIMLDQPTTHHLRVDGDGAASLRAASWFGAAAQTLMQMVGP